MGGDWGEVHTAPHSAAPPHPPPTGAPDLGFGRRLGRSTEGQKFERKYVAVGKGELV